MTQNGYEHFCSCYLHAIYYKNLAMFPNSYLGPGKQNKNNRPTKPPQALVQTVQRPGVVIRHRRKGAPYVNAACIVYTPMCLVAQTTPEETLLRHAHIGSEANPLVCGPCCTRASPRNHMVPTFEFYVFSNYPSTKKVGAIRYHSVPQ